MEEYKSFLNSTCEEFKESIEFQKIAARSKVQFSCANYSISNLENSNTNMSSLMSLSFKTKSAFVTFARERIIKWRASKADAYNDKIAQAPFMLFLDEPFQKYINNYLPEKLTAEQLVVLEKSLDQIIQLTSRADKYYKSLLANPEVAAILRGHDKSANLQADYDRLLELVGNEKVLSGVFGNTKVYEMSNKLIIAEVSSDLKEKLASEARLEQYLSYGTMAVCLIPFTKVARLLKIAPSVIKSLIFMKNLNLQSLIFCAATTASISSFWMINNFLTTKEEIGTSIAFSEEDANTKISHYLKQLNGLKLYKLVIF